MPRQYAKPTTKRYYQISTGKSGIHFEWIFHGRPRSSFGVELHFEKENREFNKAAIDKIEIFKSEIEQKTNEKVIFQNDWVKNYARLYIEKNEGKMTEELKEWAVKNMKIFIEILQPIIDNLG